MRIGPAFRFRLRTASRGLQLPASTGCRAATFNFQLSTFNRLAAFTLIEIMIVVGIMGIMITMGVPIVYKTWHKAPYTQAIRDIKEVLSNARARAILQGHEVDVIFHPREGRMELGAAPAAPNPDLAGGLADVAPESSPPPAARSGLSAQIPDSVGVEMLDINLTEYVGEEYARARFFPNGTCDELRIVLVSDKGERCEIQTEVTTALADVEYDFRKFR